MLKGKKKENHITFYVSIHTSNGLFFMNKGRYYDAEKTLFFISTLNTPHDFFQCWLAPMYMFP